MRITTPHFYPAFRCIAGACPDTCCSGWQVVLDEAAYARYQSLPEELHRRLQDSLVIEGDEISLHPQKNGDCPFLNREHLCDLYPAVGNEGLCHPCRTYPRIFEEFGMTREVTLSLSCPVAAELILGSEAPISFQTEVTDEPLCGTNEIDAELYFALKSARDAMIALVQNRCLASVAERAALLVSFAHALQKAIDCRDYAAMDAVTAEYRDPALLREKLTALQTYRGHAAIRQRNTLRTLHLLRDEMHPMSDIWFPRLDAAIACYEAMSPAECAARFADFDIALQREDYRFEHLLVYFIFRYALAAVDDRKLYARIKLGVFGYLAVYALMAAAHTAGSRLTLSDFTAPAQRFSREVEHSPMNLAVLRDALGHRSEYTLRQLLWTLLG